MSADVLAVAIGGGGAWVLVGWLVRYIIKSQAADYAERVADLKAHGAEKTEILRDQLATGAQNAASLERITTGVEATQRLVEALPAALNRERAT